METRTFRMDPVLARLEVWTLPIVSAINAFVGVVFVVNGRSGLPFFVGLLILATVPLLLWTAYRSYREYRDQRIVVSNESFRVTMGERVVLDKPLNEIVSLVKFASPIGSPKAVFEVRFTDGKMFPIGWFYQNHDEIGALIEARTGLSFEVRSIAVS